jgi:alpha-beta hydrolase superfamily lysophospholipase
VVVFHGNAGGARDRVYYGLALEARGYRVVLAEYPGYGGRGGELSEDSFIRDGRETARQALAAFGGPLLVWGESLGAAVAAGVAADPTLPVAGVALITPWDRLSNLAQSLYWYLPARWLLRDRYDNIAHLEQYRGKVAVLVAERDEIIPARHSQRLYDALREPKRRWIFAGAGHNSWPVDPRASWWDEALEWLAAEIPLPPGGARGD